MQQRITWGVFIHHQRGLGLSGRSGSSSQESGPVWVRKCFRAVTARNPYGLRLLLIVGGLDQLVDQLRGEGVADPVAGLGGDGAKRDEQVGLGERSAGRRTARRSSCEIRAHCSARLEHGLARWPVGTAYGIPADG